jgi:tRNA A-37 threonylcarbamoyl transferase component Bud32
MTTRGRRRFGMRASLVRNLIVLVLLTCGAILTVTIVGAYRSVGRLSGALISRATDQTEAQLESFFGLVENELLVAREWGRSGILEISDTDFLNPIFMSSLQQRTPVSSLMIADTLGREYMLLRETDTFISRDVAPQSRGGLASWSRWRDYQTRVEEWTEDLGYDPRVRPWYQGAMSTEGESEVHWTDPYIFFTTKDPGITASVRWSPPGDPRATHVLGFDVLLLDISRFTSNLDVSDNGVAIVLTEDGKVLGLPRHDRFVQTDSLKAAVLTPVGELGLPALADAVGEWRGGGAGISEAVRFRSGGARWWAGFRPYSLGGGRNLWIAVVLPESDLLADINSQRNRIILITLVALALAILTAVLLDRAMMRRISSAVSEALQLGQYTLEAKLGQGGMGAVYRARHAMLRRPTAVKLLRSEFAADKSALARFEREVQLTSQLTSSNTIEIFDYGRTSDDVFYYAMEYIEGVDLQDLIDRYGPMSPGRVIYVLTQACGSLHEAHTRDLVHRDIKPSNIMLCQRGVDFDVVKVLDFGLVKDVKAGQDVAITVADDASVTGTPLYISPEAIRNEVLDGRADIYALGAVGYFLLTGRIVFEATSPMVALAMHLQEEPTRPSELLDGIPEDLEVVILGCLAKDRDMRPDDAQQLAEMLTACRSAGDWDNATACRWWQEHGGEVHLQSADKAESVATADGAMTVDLKMRTDR